jgi:hypothetical protein
MTATGAGRPPAQFPLCNVKLEQPKSKASRLHSIIAIAAQRRSCAALDSFLKLLLADGRSAIEKLDSSTNC